MGELLSKQVRLIYMHASRHDSVTLAHSSHMKIINQNKLVVVCIDTFDQSQTHKYNTTTCVNVMNMKENILFLMYVIQSGEFRPREVKYIVMDGCMLLNKSSTVISENSKERNRQAVVPEL